MPAPSGISRLSDRITTLTLSKDASDVNTLAEMAGGDNANNLYHFRKHLKVVAAAEER